MSRADIKEKVQEYLSFVKQAGFQVASKVKLTDEVVSGLNSELLTVGITVFWRHLFCILKVLRGSCKDDSDKIGG